KLFNAFSASGENLTGMQDPLSQMNTRTAEANRRKAKDKILKDINDIRKKFQLYLSTGVATLGDDEKFKKQRSFENKYQSLLEKRRSILEGIEKIERDALQTGMSKTNSEL